MKTFAFILCLFALCGSAFGQMDVATLPLPSSTFITCGESWIDLDHNINTVIHIPDQGDFGYPGDISLKVEVHGVKFDLLMEKQPDGSRRASIDDNGTVRTLIIDLPSIKSSSYTSINDLVYHATNDDPKGAVPIPGNSIGSIIAAGGHSNGTSTLCPGLSITDKNPNFHVQPEQDIEILDRITKLEAEVADLKAQLARK